jgi:uncharacterized membrane protein
MYHILAVISAVLWAIQAFMIKYSRASPIMAFVIMNIVAAISSLVIYVISKPQWPSVESVSFLVLAGILGPVVGTLLYLYALALTKNTSVVIALSFTSPLFAVIIGYLFYKEILTLRQMAGTLCIIIGIILISTHH